MTPFNELNLQEKLALLKLDLHIADFFSCQKAELDNNDVLILYTDGVTEAENIYHEFYGMERFLNQIRQNFHQSAAKIQQAIIADLAEFTGTYALQDDVTLLAIKKIKDELN